MKNIIKVITILILTYPLFAQQTNYKADVSKRGTTAAPFLNISMGARAAGMGSAFVAVADDQSAIYWNVAGLAKMEKSGFMVDHTQWFAELKYNFIAGSINLGDFGALGVSIISSDYGEMKVRTITKPDGTGETFQVSDFAVSLAWAVNITDNFSIGFNPKVIYQGIWDMSATTFACDLGILYNTPFKGVTLGMSVTNFGPNMELDGRNAIVLNDPDEQNDGSPDRIPTHYEMEKWPLPLCFRVGVAYEALKTAQHKWIIALDALHPNDDYESVNIGTEYSFDNIFFVRAGYKSLFMDDSEESYTFGAGFRQRIAGNLSIKFDYSYGTFNRLDNNQKFSISVNF